MSRDRSDDDFDSSSSIIHPNNHSHQVWAEPRFKWSGKAPCLGIVFSNLSRATYLVGDPVGGKKKIQIQNTKLLMNDDQYFPLGMEIAQWILDSI